MKKLIDMIQKARAGEQAAYLAYEGHWRSLKDPADRKRIQKMQEDEMHHIVRLDEILEDFGEKPRLLRGLWFMLIGYVASALCFVTGRKLPILGALVIEKIGSNGYIEMAREAFRVGRVDLRDEFLHFALTEMEHEETLRKMNESESSKA